METSTKVTAGASQPQGNGGAVRAPYADRACCSQAAGQADAALEAAWLCSIALGSKVVAKHARLCTRRYPPPAGDWAEGLRHGQGTLWVRVGGRFMARYRGGWCLDHPEVMRH